MRRGVGKQPGANPDYDNGAEPKARPAPAHTPVVVVPKWLATAGPNIAPAAEVSAPGAAALLNDGQANVADNNGRWLGKGKLPQSVEFSWKEPVTIGAARIISGFNTGGQVIAPLADFALQWHDGTEWKEIPSASMKNNLDPYWSGIFAPVKTAKLRLCITKTHVGTARVWEVEFYGPVTQPTAQHP